jgi:hypothetical protein
MEDAAGWTPSLLPITTASPYSKKQDPTILIKEEGSILQRNSSISNPALLYSRRNRYIISSQRTPSSSPSGRMDYE